LKTHDGLTSVPFKDASQHRDLFNDEATWDNTLGDAAISNMPCQLRELFAYICIFALPGNAAQLFEKFKQNLFEDFVRHAGHTDECPCCESLALRDIQSTLILHGKKCEDFGLLTPPSNFVVDPANQYNDLLEKQTVETMMSTLNDEQKMAFATVMNPFKMTICHSDAFSLMALAVLGKLTCSRHFLAPFVVQKNCLACCLNGHCCKFIGRREDLSLPV